MTIYGRHIFLLISYKSCHSICFPLNILPFPFLFVVITFLVSVDFNRLTLYRILTCVYGDDLYPQLCTLDYYSVCLSCICYTLLLQECKNKIKYLSIKYPSDLFSFIMFPLQLYAEQLTINMLLTLRGPEIRLTCPAIYYYY